MNHLRKPSYSFQIDLRSVMYDKTNTLEKHTVLMMQKNSFLLFKIVICCYLNCSQKQVTAMRSFQNSGLIWLFFLILSPCSGNLRPGFSQIQHGHRLDGSMINSFTEFSFLDCVMECLVTARCVSVNYYKGANFCEMNYKNKNSAEDQFATVAGWVYSEKNHWAKVNINNSDFI